MNSKIKTLASDVAQKIYKNPSNYISIIELANSQITEFNQFEQKEFWKEVYENLGGELSPMFESQDSSKLFLLIARAKIAIKNKTN